MDWFIPIINDHYSRSDRRWITKIHKISKILRYCSRVHTEITNCATTKTPWTVPFASKDKIKLLDETFYIHLCESNESKWFQICWVNTQRWTWISVTWPTLPSPKVSKYTACLTKNDINNRRVTILQQNMRNVRFVVDEAIHTGHLMDFQIDSLH